MSISVPAKMPVPWATSGLKNTIPATSDPVTGLAGYDQGFTTINMTPRTAGGIPPFGQDFNGIFYAVTEALRYLETGALFPYDSTFATAVGGYPLGAKLQSADGYITWLNTVANNTSDPDAFGAGWAPSGSGITSVAMSNANVTLTAQQAGRSIIVITGTLTANLNLVFPLYQKQWLVVNNATGPFAVTCKTAAGSGVTVATGSTSTLYGDGVNIAVASQTVTQAAVQGTAKNLQASATGTSATVTETADEIILENSAGQFVTLRNVSLSGALTSSGANGLDNQAPQTVTITIASPGVVTLNGHGFPANAAVVLATSGALPTGLTAGTTYYVVSPTVNTFQLSATQGGAAINTSGTQSGAHTVASVLAPNCWYSKWQIYNGTSAALLFSSSASAPVLPLGYTYKASTEWVRSDGSGNRFPLSFTQFGKRWQYKVAAGSNVTFLPVLISGVQGNIATPTWVAASLSSAAPPTAGRISVALINATLNTAAIAAPNNSYAGYGSNTGAPPLVGAAGSASAGGYISMTGTFNIESGNFYYASGASLSSLVCLGWEGN